MIQISDSSEYIFVVFDQSFFDQALFRYSVDRVSIDLH